MKKKIKYIVGIVVVLALGYNSVYFKKLDEVKASSSKFDSKAYARNYFDTKLQPSVDSALELGQLLNLLKVNQAETFSKYSHALGMGNIKYFLIKDEGQVIAVNENEVSVMVQKDTVRIATEFIFGNAVRDAAGGIDINEFKNTIDFNNVSSEINKIIRAEVLPSFKASVKKGDRIQFAGAIELNQQHLHLADIEIIPVELKIAVH